MEVTCYDTNTLTYYEAASISYFIQVPDICRSSCPDRDR